MAYVHSKAHYAATKKRNIHRMIDQQQSYGYDRTPSPAQKRMNEAVAAVRFTKRGGTHHAVNDLPHDKHAASGFDYAINEQKYAMTMFPEAKTVGEALSKFYATPIGKATITARLRDDYAEGQKRAALGAGAAGTDPLIYGPNWRPAAWEDSSPPFANAPAGDGTQSASAYPGSRSAADGSPAAASSQFIGKLDRDMILAIAKQTMGGVYSKVRKQLVAMNQWPDDWIDSALIRHERSQ
jgi:hypothetical protein